MGNGPFENDRRADARDRAARYPDGASWPLAMAVWLQVTLVLVAIIRMRLPCVFRSASSSADMSPFG